MAAAAASALGGAIGKLVDVKWKVGVAAASNLSDQINTPYVTLSLKVADNEGKISDHTFELTIAEFQVFLFYSLIIIFHR